MLVKQDSNHQCGNYWYDSEHDISVFEDTQEGRRVYYAWFGDADYHDEADHTSNYSSADNAIAALNMMGRTSEQWALFLEKRFKGTQFEAYYSEYLRYASSLEKCEEPDEICKDWVEYFTENPIKGPDHEP